MTLIYYYIVFGGETVSQSEGREVFWKADARGFALHRLTIVLSSALPITKYNSISFLSISPFCLRTDESFIAPLLPCSAPVRSLVRSFTCYSHKKNFIYP